MILRFFKIMAFCAIWGLSVGAYAQPGVPASDGLLKAEELDSIVAPIVLYPDSLLSLVLMASTYPLEVVQADRWLKDNGQLKGDALKAALDKQAWDGSVKSLTAAPEVLSMMSSKLDWTQRLGDTVLSQQPDVMDAIQRLRAKADAGKKLVSTKEQKVSKRQDAGKEVIVIEQTDADTIYVPYYDPAVVYGGWPYPDHPPYALPWPGYIPVPCHGQATFRARSSHLALHLVRDMHSAVGPPVAITGAAGSTGIIITSTSTGRG